MSCKELEKFIEEVYTEEAQERGGGSILNTNINNKHKPGVGHTLKVEAGRFL